MSMSLKTKATYVDNEKVKKLFEKYDLNKKLILLNIFINNKNK